MMVWLSAVREQEVDGAVPVHAGTSTIRLLVVHLKLYLS